MSILDTLDPKYRLILCDIWGVIHDGIHLYPGAQRRLEQWKDEGRCVGLITNAPRTQEAVERQLDRLGLPRNCYDFVATSGEAGIEALTELESAVGFIGTPGDRAILEGRGVKHRRWRRLNHLACTGIMEGRPDPAGLSHGPGALCCAQRNNALPEPGPSGGAWRTFWRPVREQSPTSTSSWAGGWSGTASLIGRFTTTRCTAPASRA